jgi:putative transposase
VVSRAAKRHAAAALAQTHGVSERRACRVLSLPRRSQRRQPGQPARAAWVARIPALAERYPRVGWRPMVALLTAAPWPGSRETVRRLRQRAGLPVVQTARTRGPVGTNTAVPSRAAPPPHVWRDALGHAATPAGRRRKCLTGLDEETRAGLTIDCARSITAGAVVQGLPQLFAHGGAPGDVQRDHGPEGMAPQVTPWRRAHQVDPTCMPPGSPWQHGPHASCHGVFRDGCLARWLVTAVQAARRRMIPGREEDHHERPPGALDGLTPAALAAQSRASRETAA